MAPPPPTTLPLGHVNFSLGIVDGAGQGPVMGRSPHLRIPRMAVFQLIGKALNLRVIGARFQQKHRAGWVLRQPGGRGTARRSCSNDYDVILHGFLLFLERFPPTLGRPGYCVDRRQRSISTANHRDMLPVRSSNPNIAGRSRYSLCVV